MRSLTLISDFYNVCKISVKICKIYVKIYKVSVKCCKILFSGVILKFRNNVLFLITIYISRKNVRLFSKNKESFWLRGLYEPTMSNFLNRIFISRYMSCQFLCLNVNLIGWM